MVLFSVRILQLPYDDSQEYHFLDVTRSSLHFLYNLVYHLIFTTDFMGRVNFQRNILLERIPETRPIEKTRKIRAFSLAAEL